MKEMNKKYLKDLFFKAAQEDVNFDLKHRNALNGSILQYKDKDYFTLPIFNCVNRYRKRKQLCIIPMRMINELESYAKSFIIIHMKLKKLAGHDITEVNVVDDNYDKLSVSYERDQAKFNSYLDKGVNNILHNDLWNYQVKVYNMIKDEWVNE